MVFTVLAESRYTPIDDDILESFLSLAISLLVGGNQKV